MQIAELVKSFYDNEPTHRPLVQTEGRYKWQGKLLRSYPGSTFQS